MFGKPCKVCAEKDKRVSSLEAEIAFLRQLVRPNVDNSISTSTEYEANGVIDGLTTQIEFQTRTQKLSDEEIADLKQRDDILSGNY